MSASRNTLPLKKLAAPTCLAIASLLALAMSGCSFVTDDSTALDEQIDGLATAATDAAMEAQSSFEEAWSESDARSILGEFVSAGDLSKNGAIIVSSANGEKRYEGSEAADVLASLDFARWTPVAAGEFESLTSGTTSPVSMTLSQDKTVLLGESSPSGRLDVASVSFWPDERMAKFEVTVDASEGIYLLDELGITTKEKTALVTLHFRIPETAAEYTASL